MQIILLIVSIWLLGHVVWLHAAKLHISLKGDETLFFIIASGLLPMIWFALLLAEFNQFHITRIFLFAFLLSCSLFMLFLKRGGRYCWPKLTWERHNLGLAVLLLTLVAFANEPFEYIVGGRDHGVYVNTGVHIARSGGILVKDSVIAEVPEASRLALVNPEVRPYQSGFPGPWSEGQHLIGMTIRDLDEGIYVPHGFHLYPAFIAILYAVGGIHTALWATGILTLLSVCAIFLVIRHVLGWQVALLSLLFLSVSVTQMWFSRYPSAEILIQFLFWSGLFFTLKTIQTKHWLPAFLAGACFGLTHLAKLDSIFISATVLSYFAYLWFSHQFDRSYLITIATYICLTIHAVLHAFHIATIYFIDHLVRVLLPSFLANRLVLAAENATYPLTILKAIWVQNTVLLGVGVVSFILLISLLIWGQATINQILQFVMKYIVGIHIVGVSLTLIFFITVYIYGADADYFTFTRQGYISSFLMRLYLSRIGLIVGFAGFILLLFRADTQSKRFLWWMLVGNIFYFFLFGSGATPDHFWVVRRFTPIAIPAFLIMASFLIWYIGERISFKLLQISFLVGICSLLMFGLGQHTFPLLAANDYDGLIHQLDTFSDTFSSEDILLFSEPHSAATLTFPLWMQHDLKTYHIRASYLNTPELDNAIASWLEQGRDVYWITTVDTVNVEWGMHKLVPRQDVTITVPFSERTFDRIPRQLTTLTYNLQVSLLEQR